MEHLLCLAKNLLYMLCDVYKVFPLHIHQHLLTIIYSGDARFRIQTTRL